MIGDYLEQHNMRAFAASGQKEMVRHFAASEPDLVILDLRLDDADGLDLLREIRTRSDIPVIIVTRDRCDEIDRVVGLELGADDYLKRNRSACGNSWRASAPVCGAAKLAAPRCNAMPSVAGASLAAGNWTGACVA